MKVSRISSNGDKKKTHTASIILYVFPLTVTECAERSTAISEKKSVSVTQCEIKVYWMSDMQDIINHLCENVWMRDKW